MNEQTAVHPILENEEWGTRGFPEEHVVVPQCAIEEQGERRIEVLGSGIFQAATNLERR